MQLRCCDSAMDEILRSFPVLQTFRSQLAKKLTHLILIGTIFATRFDACWTLRVRFKLSMLSASPTWVSRQLRPTCSLPNSFRARIYRQMFDSCVLQSFFKSIRDCSLLWNIIRPLPSELHKFTTLSCCQLLNDLWVSCIRAWKTTPSIFACQRANFLQCRSKLHYIAVSTWSLHWSLRFKIANQTFLGSMFLLLS